MEAHLPGNLSHFFFFFSFSCFTETTLHGGWGILRSFHRFLARLVLGYLGLLRTWVSNAGLRAGSSDLLQGLACYLSHVPIPLLSFSYFGGVLPIRI